MSDLHNPLFDEEKDFLERKKLEYERALRGDVDHIKDQSVKVGKVALVGAGLAGGIWLIAKAFSGKKRKHRAHTEDHEDYDGHGSFDRDEADNDYEFGSEYFTAANGKRYRDTRHKSAADSARVFMKQDEHAHESDDLGFGSTAGAPSFDTDTTYGSHDRDERDESPFDAEYLENDPFQDLPYDDSRRLPASRAFDSGEAYRASPSSTRSKMIASVLQSFLKSDTGKVLVAQVAAVALAVVTKKLGEFFPPAKNADLATSPGYKPAESGFAPAATSVPLDSPDASTHPQSL